MNLDGKIILVVGGAAGIGRAAAELCAERGASVIVADRQPAPGWAGSYYPVDVTDEGSVREMMAGIQKEQNRLDALVLTAGILQGAYTPLDDLSVETFRKVLEVNVTGSFLCVQYGAPLLRNSPAGVVILLSSGAATGGSSSLAYGSSKGGVNGLAVTLEKRLAAENIRLNVVSPGNIDTGMKRSVIAVEADRQGKPLEQAVSESNLGSPLGVAKVIAWLVSDEAEYVRGMISTR